jgi:RNA polymerase sigma factor (sigma-70 family)
MLTEAPTTAREVVETLLLSSEERCLLLRIAQGRYRISKDSAEDLLQDIAVDFLGQRQSVRQPRAYLHSVFRLRCSRLTRAPRSDRETVPLAEELADTGPGASVVELDRRLYLRQGIQLLSPTCRKLLKARYIEGHSLRESADRIALAYSGITKTISRCLKRLRACLA